MNKAFDALVVGELNVDLIMNKIDALPQEGKEVIAQSLSLCLGSSSAILASNLQTLGTNVCFAGKLGNDHFGKFVLTTLRSKDVNTDCIEVNPSWQTGLTVALNYGEDRAMITHPGAMVNLTADDISDEMLESARHLHISSVFLQPGLVTGITNLLKRAKAAGLTTSIDPQWDPSELWEIPIEKWLESTDVFLPNAAEIKAITNSTSIDAAIESLKQFSTIIVVKNGGNGALLFHSGKFIHQPAFKNHEIVDCIGAGDSFNAGFIHYFLQKKALEDCLSFAALMGAINTMSAGGIESFQSFEQIRKKAFSNFNYII